MQAWVGMRTPHLGTGEFWKTLPCGAASSRLARPCTGPPAIDALGVDVGRGPRRRCRPGRDDRRVVGGPSGDPYASTQSLTEAITGSLGIARFGEDRYGRTLAAVAGEKGDLRAGRSSTDTPSRRTGTISGASRGPAPQRFRVRQRDRRGNAVPCLICGDPATVTSHLTPRMFAFDIRGNAKQAYEGREASRRTTRVAPRPAPSTKASFATATNRCAGTATTMPCKCVRVSCAQSCTSSLRVTRTEIIPHKQ